MGARVEHDVIAGRFNRGELDGGYQRGLGGWQPFGEAMVRWALTFFNT